MMSPMVTLRAHARTLLFVIALAVVCDVARGEVGSPPVAALSPDQRPVLVLVLPLGSLQLVHHAHPLPPSKAEQLALKLGLLIAVPILRRHAHESVGPLPAVWRTDTPDRGFSQELMTGLDRTETNWPWRALRRVGSLAEAESLATELRGQDVAITTFSGELEDLERSVQLSVTARVVLLRTAAAPREARIQMLIRHLAPPLAADAARPTYAAGVFRAGGVLDQQVSEAARDLSRALAVTIARLATPTPAGVGVSRRVADLAVKPKCSECRPEDVVLHEEPARVWVAPARIAGTILSLPR